MSWYLHLCITSAGSFGCGVELNAPMPDLNTCTSVLAFTKTDSRYANAIATCSPEKIRAKPVPQSGKQKVTQ